MSKFSLYLLKLFLKNLAVVSLFVMILLWLSSAYGNLNILDGYDYSAVDFIVVGIYSTILGINPIIPIIISVSIIVTMIILMRSNELLAYMVIGGSLARLSIPLVLIGVVISSFMLFMDYKAVPEVREVRENMLKTMRDMPVSNNASGFYDTWFLDKNQVITHISLVSISEKTIYGVDEYILDKNGRISNINKTEKLVKEDDKWVAYNTQQMSILSNPPEIKHIDRNVLNDDSWDRLISISTSDIRAYTPTELYTLIQLFREKGINTDTLELNLYYKFAYAVSVIVLIILLYPISINFSINYSIVKNASLTFSISLVFILVQHSSRSLGSSGIIPPIAATFGPIIIFLCIGIFLIYYRSLAK